MGLAQALTVHFARVARASTARCQRWVLALGCALGACGGDSAPIADAGDPEICDELRDPLAQPGDAIDGDTYVTLAQPFFESYCVRCHDSALTTLEARGGAPGGYDWDQLDTIRMHLPEIRNAVGVTGFMPFNAPFPSCAERVRLVRWIDADAP